MIYFSRRDDVVVPEFSFEQDENGEEYVDREFRGTVEDLEFV